MQDAVPMGLTLVPMPEQRLSITVYYEDTDAGGVVYYANYLRFLERARTEWLRGLGFAPSALLRDTGLAFAVRDLTVEFLKPARLDDVLTVTAGVADHGRAQVVFAQRIECAGELLLTARVRVACLDLARGKPAAMPKALYEILRNRA